MEQGVVPNLAAEVLAEVAGGTELKAWVKIRQPKELKAKELKVFNSLRLSVVLLVEVPIEVLTDVVADVATDVITEIAAELVAELRAQVKIRQPKELKVFNSLRLSVVLLMAIRY